MKFTQKDFDESAALAEYVQRIDHMDADYVNRISDEMYQFQPFFLTVCLGYRLDVSPVELEEIFMLAFLVWEYFRPNNGMRTNKVTESQYEKVFYKNIDMLADSENSTAKSRNDTYESDLQNLQSKALFAAILHRCNSRPVMKAMNEKTVGIILVGFKSFIECFEGI